MVVDYSLKTEKLWEVLKFNQIEFSYFVDIFNKEFVFKGIVLILGRKKRKSTKRKKLEKEHIKEFIEDYLYKEIEEDEYPYCVYIEEADLENYPL